MGLLGLVGCARVEQEQLDVESDINSYKRVHGDLTRMGITKERGLLDLFDRNHVATSDRPPLCLHHSALISKFPLRHSAGVSVLEPHVPPHVPIHPLGSSACVPVPAEWERRGCVHLDHIGVHWASHLHGDATLVSMEDLATVVVTLVPNLRGLGKLPKGGSAKNKPYSLLLAASFIVHAEELFEHTHKPGAGVAPSGGSYSRGVGT